MKNKIIPIVLSLVMMMGFGFMSANTVEAQTYSFPAGCSSALGYSITTGSPCNGTGTATVGPLPGCTTALGYSVMNGTPCSGASFAISYLAGCTSVNGYSIIDGKACNGMAVAYPPNVVVPTPTPGLPTTGAGGNALGNIAILLSSGLIALAGLAYVSRKSSLA